MDFNTAYKLISQKLTLWLHELIKLLPNILLAAIILVLGFFIAKWIRNLVSKVVHRFLPNATLGNLFTSIVYIFFLILAVFTALSILQLSKAVTSILAGAGILGLGLAFAFQDIAANFISGVFISFRKPLHLGDIVKIKDYMGKVEEINLRDTVLRTFQGQMVIIPNKDVFQNPIENFSLLGKRRMDLPIGVSYGDDLEKVKKITLDTVKNIKHLSKEDEPTLFYTKFDESTINFVVRLWVNSPEQIAYLETCSEAMMLLKKAYDENDIMMPSPVRTLDFGVKGGKTLSEMMMHITNETKIKEDNEK